MSLEHPPPSSGFPLVDRILDGTAPHAARSAAARGAVPLPREALILVLVHLAGDADASIRAETFATLESIPQDELGTILASPHTDPRVLSFYALWPRLVGEPLIGLITNPALDDKTLVRIAAKGSSAAVDCLLFNQERLAATPAAIEALSANAGLTADQRRRLLDFVEHLERPEETPETAALATAEGPLPQDLLGPVSDAELKGLLGQLGDLSLLNFEVGDLMQESGTIEWDEVFESQGRNFESVYTQLLRMTPAQRLRAALLGGREARQILVRDSNRIISSAVLKNPRITEEELVGLSNQKSLAEHLLRQIGSSRAWMGCYQIVLNLVRNPKTPLAIAMNHMGRLSNKDLALIGKDRNVAEAITRAARRQLELRQPKATTLRKH